jgi:inhibitor of KinA
MTALLPLGDQAALAYFASEIEALHFAEAVRQANDAWLVDVVAAYQSVGVYYDLTRVGFTQVTARLHEILRRAGPSAGPPRGKLHHIPCCYEMQSDLQRVTEFTGLTADKVIELHCQREYTVYAIGFCPGFPYLGYLPAELCDVPRLTAPRLRVDAGSVGMTGRQTGIYSESRPGGWNLIGRTPLEIVNVADGYFPLRSGDRVQFDRITAGDFERLKGKRLMSDE